MARKKKDREWGVNPLHLTDGWKKKKSPREPDPVKKSVTCANCHSMFFGNTSSEAQARLSAHNCSRPIGGTPTERRRTH